MKQLFKHNVLSLSCTANEGPVRIKYKCLVSIYGFPEMNLLFLKQNYNVLSPSSYTPISVRDLYISRIHVVGRVELASPRQVKGLLRNCGPILEKLRGNKKVILSLTVRYFRETCCDVREHCINVGQPGYRRSMLAELEDIREAMVEQCREDGLTLYKVASTVDLVGIMPWRKTSSRSSSERTRST